jgi:hypothetical protein
MLDVAQSLQDQQPRSTEAGLWKGERKKLVKSDSAPPPCTSTCIINLEPLHQLFPRPLHCITSNGARVTLLNAVPRSPPCFLFALLSYANSYDHPIDLCPRFLDLTLSRNPDSSRSTCQNIYTFPIRNESSRLFGKTSKHPSSYWHVEL